jgi:hypothetical protein
MAKLKPHGPRVPSLPSVAEDDRVTPAMVLGDDPRHLVPMTEAQRRRRHALRRELGTAALCGPHDPRHALRLADDAWTAWAAARLAWAGAWLAADPRVRT